MFRCILMLALYIFVTPVSAAESPQDGALTEWRSEVVRRLNVAMLDRKTTGKYNFARLASDVGLSRVTLHNFATNVNPINLDAAAKIAGALNVSREWLLAFDVLIPIFAGVPAHQIRISQIHGRILPTVRTALHPPPQVAVAACERPLTTDLGAVDLDKLIEEVNRRGFDVVPR